MPDHLARLIATRKTGREPFHADGTESGFDLLSFWQWDVSDLVSNATRGRLAEYLVARALGVAGSDVRDEWAAFDLLTPTGVRVEVKSAAYLQSWHQKRFSSIQFKVRATRSWDADTNVLSRESRRQAHVYVFALLAHRDKQSIDPMNVSQWEFYVLPTKSLDERARSQHSITLKSLKALCGDGVRFDQLRLAVESAAGAVSSGIAHTGG